MFSTIFKKACCIFGENKIFEKSKMVVKMADMMFNPSVSTKSIYSPEHRIFY